MQFNSNGFYWLGDSSECSSSVQLHKGALQAFTRQSATFSSQSRAHAFTCTLAFTHTWTKKKKKIQFLLNNGGTEMKQPTEATSLYTFCRYLLSVCVCVCAMCMIAYDCVCCVIHSKQFLTFISLVTCGKLQKVISSY